MSDRSHVPSPFVSALAHFSVQDPQDAEQKAGPDESYDSLPVTKTNPHAAGPAQGAPAIQKLPSQFGRYRLIRELGRGGMGTVFLAEDTQLGRQVALKIPFLKKASPARTLKRFQREAKAAAGLSHPNICAVYDFGTFKKLPFLSMAYLEGRPLQDFLDQPALIPQRTAAGIVRKIASALQHAHERGVIHRDLKPSNIMIESKRGPVVMDFGLARCLDEEGEAQLTQEGATLGTPAYMSPEQVEGDPADVGPASDMFSLGLIFFEMLTGQRRFQGRVTSIIGQILTKAPPSLREIRADVDPQLDLICQKMMAREPAKRYASMEEVAQLMRAYCKGELTARRQMQTPDHSIESGAFFAELAALHQQAPIAPATQTNAGLDPTQEEMAPAIVISEGDSLASHILQKHAQSRKSKWLWAGGLVGMLALASAGAWLLGHLNQASPPLAVPQTTSSRDVEPAETQDAEHPVPPAETEPEHPLPAPADESEAITNIEDAEEVTWEFAEIPSPMAEPASAPAPESPPSSSPATEEPEPVPLKMAQGKLDFQALVSKTINGNTTEKRFKSPRLALSEVAMLERRQSGSDKNLEQVRAVLLLNGNAFAYQDMKPAREAVMALDEATRQNIPIEDILERLQSLSSDESRRRFSLPPSERARINKEIFTVMTTKVPSFVSRLNRGRGPRSQRDIDLAQAYFERECRSIPGIPQTYPLPKLRITVAPAGVTNPSAFQTLTGDSERLKEQNPRHQLIHRLAEALRQSTRIAVPEA